MLQDRLLMFGVAGLAAIATAGWMRNPVPVAAQNAITMPSVQQLQPEPFATLTPVDHRRAVGAPVYSSRRAVTQIQNVSARTQQAPVVYDDRGYSAESRRERSKLKSAAIIGGGAAAGAAIGAAAGGGKGAVIGAVSGGAAGLVYDRMTRQDEHRDDRTYRTAREDRTPSTAQSVAIVGGGAAAGAAIGAAAGGGKGAAIGALGGGAAGYIYDRMTRSR